MEILSRGVAGLLQTRYLKGSNFCNSKFFRYFWYKFFDIKFFILENVIPQMSLWLTYQTCASIFWSTKYTQRKIHLLGIYVVVKQVTLRPKKMIHTFVTQLDLVSIFCKVSASQTLRTVEVVSKGQKRKKDRKQRKKQNFLALGDLVRSSNKVFIEGNSLLLDRQFLRQQYTYMTGWLRDKVMWLRLTTMRYF